jgi:hypothetical protein
MEDGSMRFRGLSISIVAVTLLSLVTSEARAQRGRLGMLRPAPRPSIRGPIPRMGTLSQHFFTSCFIAPAFSPFFPFFGGVPFVNIQVFTGSQPSPDPGSHPAPDPNSQPVPLPGPQPVPGLQPVPGTQPVPGSIGSGSVQVFAAPMYSAPVYTVPVYAGAAPIATPQVSNGMVVGDVIVDPTFGLSGSAFFPGGGGFFFGGGGIVCAPTRFFGGGFIR